MPESLGKILKRVRESKHLSLEDVSERSRISKHIVLTIEDDRLSEIKSGFYAKSFVKTYAGFLGALNEPSVKEYLSGGQPHQNVIAKTTLSREKPEAISRDCFAEFTPRQKAPPACPEPLDFARDKLHRGVKTGMNGAGSGFARTNPAIKDATAVLRQAQDGSKDGERSRTIKPSSFTTTSIAKYKNQIIAIIIGILVFWILSTAVGSICKFIKKSSAKKQNKTAVVKKEAPKKIEKEKPKDVITIKDVKKEVSNEKSDFVELEVFASDNTWLQVIGDGEIMFTGLFKKGGKDIWKAKKEIKLEAGNSGVVKINVNGKPAGFSGKKGEKKKIVITKDGMKN